MKESAPASGSYSASIEGDLLRFRIIGELGQETQLAMVAFTDRMAAAHGYCLILVDAHEVTGMSPEARHQYGKWAKENRDRLSYTVIIGANSVLRILSGFLHRAATMLSGSAATPMSFVRDEAEAQEILNRERTRLRAEVQKRGAKAGA